MSTLQQVVSCLLPGHTERKDLESSRRVHLVIITKGLESVAILGDHLIRLFASCGSLFEANLVFCKVVKPSVHTWHAIIFAHVLNGVSTRIVLKLYKKMQQDAVMPNKFIFTCILKACGSEGAIGWGNLVHETIVSIGLQSNVEVGNSLIDMYAKCGSLNDAVEVFYHLPTRSILSWGAIISGYAQHRYNATALELFKVMQSEGFKPNRIIFLCILKACSSGLTLSQGKLIHSQIIESELESDISIGSTLVDMYAKCSSMFDACAVFDTLTGRNIVSWGAIITGYVQHGHDVSALELFERMQQSGIKPDNVTFSCILKACGNMGALRQGKLVHKEVSRNGCEADLVIGSNLVDMYAKCGSMEEAHEVFNELTNRNLMSCTSIIAGHVQHDQGHLALDFFDQMIQEGMKPDKIMFLCILKACTSTGALEKGQLVHEQITKYGFESDVLVGSTLINMYATCESLGDACEVFDKLPIQDAVTCCAMIAGYVEHGHGLPALQLYEKMQYNGTRPDKVVFLCILKACACIGAMEQGKLMHDQVIECGIESDTVVGSTLIDLYARCGNPDKAWRIFDKLSHQDIVSWGAMIAGYAESGDYNLAGQCLQVMQQEGFKPNGMIYSSVLSACSQAGKVEEGRWYFKSMIEDHGITPSVAHYNCMVDLLGCVGHLNEAEHLLQISPISSDVTGWMSLLTACRNYGNMELGAKCFEEVMRLDPNTTAAYVIMSNIYADGHMWEAVHTLHEQRNCACAYKKPGMALVEVDNNMREFVVGDKSEPWCDGISTILRRLTRSTKDKGYLPHLALVIEQMFFINKEDFLF